LNKDERTILPLCCDGDAVLATDLVEIYQRSFAEHRPYVEKFAQWFIFLEIVFLPIIMQ
jgi:hypothetical protein